MAGNSWLGFRENVIRINLFIITFKKLKDPELSLERVFFFSQSCLEIKGIVATENKFR